MLHKVPQGLQNLEILEGHTHRLRFGEKSDQLTYDDCQELVSVFQVGNGRFVLDLLSQLLIFLVLCINVQMALFIVLFD